MAIGPLGDLARFHQFIGEQLGHGAELTPEAALVLWRETHPLADDDVLAAAKEALDDISNGKKGTPANEFFADFRRRHGLN
jgi:hypothetical protein